MLVQIFYKYRHNLILVDFDEKLLLDLYFVYLDNKNVQIISDMIL
jgi:hypothetical protein